MDQGSSVGLMVESTLVNIKMIKSMGNHFNLVCIAMENSSGLTVKNIKDNGKMGSSMEWAHLLIKWDKLGMVNGSTVNVWFGEVMLQKFKNERIK